MSLLIHETHANKGTPLWATANVSMSLTELSTTYSSPISSGVNTIIYTLADSLCAEVGSVYEITLSFAIAPTWSGSPTGNMLFTLGHYNSSMQPYNRSQYALSSISATSFFNGNVKLIFQRRAIDDVVAIALLHNSTGTTLNSLALSIRDFAVKKIASSTNISVISSL
jgi:hypothetical protein